MDRQTVIPAFEPSAPHCKPAAWRTKSGYKRFSSSEDIFRTKPEHMDRQTLIPEYEPVHPTVSLVYEENKARYERFSNSKDILWKKPEHIHRHSDPSMWTSTSHCKAGAWRNKFGYKTVSGSEDIFQTKPKNTDWQTLIPVYEPVHPTVNLAHTQKKQVWLQKIQKISSGQSLNTPTDIRISPGQDQQGLHLSITSNNCPLPRPVTTLKGSRTSHHPTVPADGPWGRRQAERLEGPGAAAAVPSGLSTEPAGAWTPSPLSLLSWKGSQACVCISIIVHLNKNSDL